MSSAASNRPQTAGRKGPRPAALLATVLGSAIAAQAHAADFDDNAADPPIVVVAPTAPDINPNADPDAPYNVRRSANDRLTEPLRDTPRTVIAIPQQVLDDIGATSFRDVARVTPGVTLGTGEGGNAFGDRVFIRGFEARNDVYIDGLRDPGVSSRETFAVEQIEIIRGPSGSFGGRGTTGGLVSLQSKAPVFGRSFSIIEGSAGTDDTWRGTLDTNVALSDGVSLRVNSLYHRGDTPGRDYVHSERYGTAAALAAQLSNDVTVKADYYFFRLDAVPDYGHPFDVTTQQPYKVDRDNFYGVIGRDFLENRSDIATLRLDYTPLETLEMRGVLRWGKTAGRYVVGAPSAVCRFTRTSTGACPATGTLLPEDQFTVTAGSQRRDAETETWAGIFDATARFDTGGLSHTLVLGGEFGHEKIDTYTLAIASFIEDANGNQTSVSPFIRNLLNPNPVLGGTIRVVRDGTIDPTSVTVRSLAAYAIDTIKWGERWAMTLAARLDSYDISLFNPDASTAAGLQPLSLNNSAEFLNWQASLLYKPVEAVSLYASYATSSNPSGEQIDGTSAVYDGLAPQTADLAPERNRSMEAGVKWSVADDHLLLTAALFQITKANAREQTSPGIYELVGKLRSRGVELGISGSLTPALQIFGGYTYTDAEITQSGIPANVGRRFANIPRHSGSLLLTYALTSRFQIGGQVHAQDAFFGGLQAAGTAKVPGYVRFDAVARWKPTDRFELRLNVLNLTDKRYYDAIYRSASPFAYIAPGHSATLTATYRL